ncbi:hypothetical protein SS50377_28124 [Spironucleus salmonicida]|nr:hypothetical protein SS50377_28124 [Spironucleus salmonicida]
MSYTPKENSLIIKQQTQSDLLKLQPLDRFLDRSSEFSNQEFNVAMSRYRYKKTPNVAKRAQSQLFITKSLPINTKLHDEEIQNKTKLCQMEFNPQQKENHNPLKKNYTARGQSKLDH